MGSGLFASYSTTNHINISFQHLEDASGKVGYISPLSLHPLHPLLCVSPSPPLPSPPLPSLSPVPCPLSPVPYPLSPIPYPLSPIPYPLSSILYPLSYILYPLSSILYPLSSIFHPLSSPLFIWNPTLLSFYLVIFYISFDPSLVLAFYCLPFLTVLPLLLSLLIIDRTEHSDALMTWKYLFIFCNAMLGVFLMLIEV